MKQLTNSQANWLRKAMNPNRLTNNHYWFLHAVKVGEQVYIAATDGHVCHTVPLDIEPGAYDLMKDGSLVHMPERFVADWSFLITRTERPHRFATQSRRLQDLALGADEMNGIVIHTKLEYTVDYKLLFGATSYRKHSVIHLPDEWGQPMQVTYDDGAMAFIMPIVPASLRQQWKDNKMSPGKGARVKKVRA